MLKQKQSGFTMVEVLISVLVLALGVIGVAGMQVAALRSNQQSGSQSIAVQIASELADAMRANAGEMKKDDTANVFLKKGEYLPNKDGPSKTGIKDCINESCSSSEMAEFDVYEWKRKMHERLPGGRGLLCRDSSSGSLAWSCTGKSTEPLVIKIGWYGKGKNPDGSDAEIGQDGKPVEPPALAIAVESYPK